MQGFISGHSILLTYMSVHIPVSHYLDYLSFVLSFDIRQCEFLKLCYLFSILFCLFGNNLSNFFFFFLTSCDFNSIAMNLQNFSSAFEIKVSVPEGYRCKEVSQSISLNLWWRGIIKGQCQTFLPLKSRLKEKLLIRQ